MSTAAHHPAGTGPHHLMLGTDLTSRLLGGDETDEELALIEATAPPGGGPALHVDPWRESFYVLHGELTFEVHDDAGSHRVAARRGDAVSIPRGAGHAFKITGTDPARFLVSQPRQASSGSSPTPANRSRSRPRHQNRVPPTATACWRLLPLTACSHSRPAIPPAHERTHDS